MDKPALRGRKRSSDSGAQYQFPSGGNEEELHVTTRETSTAHPLNHRANSTGRCYHRAVVSLKLRSKKSESSPKLPKFVQLGSIYIGENEKILVMCAGNTVVMQC